MLSGKRKGQAVERKSRLTIVKRLHGRYSQSLTQAVLELASQLQDKLKTLTVDHGKEFANYQAIEQLTGTNEMNVSIQLNLIRFFISSNVKLS